MMLGSLITAIFGHPRQTITAAQLDAKLEAVRAKRSIDNQPTVVFSAKHPEGVEVCRCCGAHLQRNGM